MKLNKLDLIVELIENVKSLTKELDELSDKNVDLINENIELDREVSKCKEQLEIDSMLKTNVPAGRVIFIFRDGCTKSKVFGSKCTGLTHNQERPIWFTVRIEPRGQLLEKSNIEQLNRWIANDVEPVIDPSYKEQL